MKQLRIQVDDYNATGGLLQVNFNEPIKVVPGSEISFDKFQMTVTDGLTDNFVLPNQVVLINTNSLDTNMVPRSAVIPAKKYANIGALLNQLNTSFNGILNTDLKNPFSTPDNGLFFRSWLDSTSGKVITGFGSAGIDYTNTNYITTGMTFNAGVPQWVPSAAGSYSLITSLPILFGGLDIRLDLDLAANDIYNEFEYGIFVGGTIKYGISKVGTDFFAVDNGNTIPISASHFINHANYYHQFYITQGGKLHYQVLTSEGIQVFNFEYTGYSFNGSYSFGINGTWDDTVNSVAFTNLGIIFQPNLSVDSFGWAWNYETFSSPDYLELFTIGVSAGSQPPNRIVQYDFIGGQTLQSGLGFAATVFNIGTGSGVVTGKQLADDKYGFLDYYDLAIQCPSLQIESYIASANQRTGGRINNIAYFVPTPANGTSSTIYSFDTKELIFVGISNKEIVNMNSMQFRVVYANNPTIPVQCSQMSFNLYIKEPMSI